MDPTNRNTALATALTDELARGGVSLAVICPGSRSTPLALALDRDERIPTLVVLDERSAGFVALGAATASGKPALVATTSGTAVANLHPAVAEADESGVPLIVLSSDRPPELRGIGAGQTIDQVKIFGSSVRWFCELGNHEADDDGLLHFRSVACRALAYSADPARPGPVQLNLPWREPLSPAPQPGSVSAVDSLSLHGRSGERPLTALMPRPTTPPREVIAPAAECIGGLVKGVILAGRQPDPALAPALAALSARTGYPVLAEPTSQARCTASGKALISGYEWIARYGPAALRPELIVRFGEFPTSKALRTWLGRDVEQITVLESGWNDPAVPTSSLVRGRPVPIAQAFAEALGPGDGASGWTALWCTAQNAVDRALEHVLAEPAAARDPFGEPVLHRALGRIIGTDEIVYTASSMPIRDQEAFLPPVENGTPQFLSNRGANGIDGLVSSAIGAASATGRPVWAITGDLGFVHDSNALISLSKADAPIRVVVVNNQGGAIFEHLPQAEILDREEFERLFITPSGVDLVALCAAHGVDYIRLESLEQLGELTTQTCVVEVPTDGRTDAELRRAVAAATRDALVDALSIT